MQLLEIIIFIGLDFLLIIYGSRKGQSLYALGGGVLLAYSLSQTAADQSVIAYSTLNPATGLYVDLIIPISPILVLLGILTILSFYAAIKER